jgi:hypothetical protein
VHGWEGSVLGQLAKVVGWLVQRFGRSAAGEPVVWLKIHNRQRDGWRMLDLMIDNQLQAALQVKEISLGWSNIGCRIAPAKSPGDEDGPPTRDNELSGGRTFKTSAHIRPFPGERGRWQTVSFFLRHPKDPKDNGRYTIKISALIEHSTESRRKWKITRKGQLPQQAGDPDIFSEKGPVPG